MLANRFKQEQGVACNFAKILETRSCSTGRDVISNATPKKKTEHSGFGLTFTRGNIGFHKWNPTLLTFAFYARTKVNLMSSRAVKKKEEKKNTSRSPSREYISRSYARKVTPLPLERRTTIAKHGTYDVFET